MLRGKESKFSALSASAKKTWIIVPLLDVIAVLKTLK